MQQELLSRFTSFLSGSSASESSTSPSQSSYAASEVGPRGQIEPKNHAAVRLLRDICNTLIAFLEEPGDLEEEPKTQYLMCLTGLLVLLDSLLPCGVFVRESGVQIVRAVEVCVQTKNAKARDCLSILRYSSKTFALPTWERGRGVRCRTMRKVRKMIVNATDWGVCWKYVEW